ncbi:RNA polymerase sigma factor [Ancylomarina sp. 16SWW S1-10-2]|uniref:RNA polymerase sigma factor n=1 Tax=Ancylomarina sp. 16SWW S1-10-2 TaxID=2499681 RepID=UPI0012ADC865|nr:RNA polymerase sigma factor [Ancylomarina sp. 16SWW S1-10-2]MRT93948.1 RNA polymerase sigma factor [Ancylomarina sp. 16SWW S1-10-2]
MTRSSIVYETNNKKALSSNKCDSIDFGVLYERHFDKVYYKCLSFSKNHDEAYDLAQEIFLKVFDKIHTFEGRSQITTWLYKLTHNYCIEYYRKKQRMKFEALDYKSMQIPVSDYIPNNYDHISIDLIMENLTDSDRILLRMKYLKGISIKELQNTFNLSSSAVKMRLKRAKQKVEKNLKLIPNVS